MRDTVARRNGGNCNSPVGRKELGVTCRKWWLYARMGGRLETLPLSRALNARSGCKVVSGGGRAVTRVPPCHGLDSTDTSEGFGC